MIKLGKYKFEEKVFFFIIQKNIFIKTNMQEKKLYYYEIPPYIQKEISEKGFAIYNWIDEMEVKSSIERDFLKFFDKVWFAIWITLIIFPIFLAITWAISASAILSSGIFWIASSILFFAILFLSIKRSLKLRKIAYIVITNNYFSLNSEIKKIKDWKIYGWEEINKLWKLFEEEVFRESFLKKSKSSIWRKVLLNLWGWYAKITHFFSAKTDSWDKAAIQLILISVVFYTIYLAVIWVFYFFGIFLLFLVWNIVAFFNKKFLLLRWHKITSINNNFENIDDLSKNLEYEKELLKRNLEQAEQNKWSDWLLNKINDTIEDVNKYSKNSIKTINKLEKEIKNSEYSEMFEFSIYNSWIKKQIISPLRQIISLLESNKNKIKEETKNIKNEINVQSDENLKQNLLLAETRLNIKKEELEKYINSVKIFIEKLEK